MEARAVPVPPVPQVLLVEPNESIGVMLMESLTDAGYRTQHVTSIPAALRLLRRVRPAPVAVVLTQAFPRPGAPFTGLAPLRAATAGALVLCTTWSPLLFATYRAHGITAILVEPLDLDDVVTTVAHLVVRPTADSRTGGG